MRRSVETSDLLKVNNKGYLPQIKGIDIKIKIDLWWPLRIFEIKRFLINPAYCDTHANSSRQAAECRILHFTFTQAKSTHGFCSDGKIFPCLFFLQFRSELCVPKRMEVIKKAISDRDFKTFAETTMKVRLHTYLPPGLLSTWCKQGTWCKALQCNFS